MSVVLVEGLDRAGKTTECRRLMALPRSKPAVMVHFVAPPKGQSVMVLEEMARVYRIACAHPELDFVLDRGHISWFVYENVLRGGGVNTADLKSWERLHPLPKGSLLVHVGADLSAEALYRRDDGQSTYTRKGNKTATLAAIDDERAEFKRFVAATGMLTVPEGVIELSWPPTLRRRLT